jgi:autophagy-related protein 9
MAPKIFGRLTASTQGGRSFYEQLRGYDDEADFDAEAGPPGEDSPSRVFGGITAQMLAAGRRNNADGVLSPGANSVHDDARRPSADNRDPPLGWSQHDDEGDEDVPASLLVESNKARANPELARTEAQLESQHYHSPDPSSGHSRAQQWRPPAEEGRLEVPRPSVRSTATPYRASLNGGASFDRKNTALWKWVNITNLDSFMRDVYDYYEGGGMWCIMCSNALWLL